MDEEDAVRRFREELSRLDPIIQDLNYRVMALEAMAVRTISIVATRAPDLAIEVLEKSLEAIPDPPKSSRDGVSAFHMGLEQILLELRLKRGK